MAGNQPPDRNGKLAASPLRSVDRGLGGEPGWTKADVRHRPPRFGVNRGLSYRAFEQAPVDYDAPIWDGYRSEFARLE
jgi:hypothetical protein